jgi:bacteriorhodopsin
MFCVHSLVRFLFFTLMTSFFLVKLMYVLTKEDTKIIRGIP